MGLIVNCDEDDGPLASEREPGDFPSKDATPLQKALDPRNNPAPADMSLEDAEAALANAVYMATELFEQLEAAKLVFGNGHHMRQYVVESATKLLRERWQGEVE